MNAILIVPIAMFAGISGMKTRLDPGHRVAAKVRAAASVTDGERKDVV